ncbi:catechol 2,3-dioxygenase-like lactoylglutathione lyase family enzyme [Novosphingobium capsulatum]|uniref:Catechol 2,3-dioxygenase-like lactoylglutathione lyase family enzyme n=2 Tax=Novosphingobium TaxID=165696 RepID=A0ABU1MKU8_9SPHN|nr:VOC family protein [Novosphingobium capsulatum]MDR6510965.1 catechol 2,3-dioxygenase-like lactoylglutathione lyase family enzyme [Novosphingobium capsulatum]
MGMAEPEALAATAVGGGHFRIRGLSHLALVVADVAVTTAFYRDRLGMAVIHDGRAEEVPNAKGMIGQLLLELEQREAKAGTDTITPALTVDDIDAAFAALADVRIGVADQPDEMFGVRYFSVRDPDGRAVELIAFPNGEADLGAFGRKFLEGSAA